MSKAEINFPYFDKILANLEDEATKTIFGNHVHWGYWENPNWAKNTAEDFAIATEKLSQKVYQAADIKDGISILDVGCGFGGTAASINNNYSEVKITGLNIDERQLNVARKQVQACGDNSIEFVQGDATKMPFPDNFFDVVLAVECIFHFPSRSAFFQEAKRVLKPGGKIALSDFFPTATINFFEPVVRLFIKDLGAETYGNVNFFTIANYQDLAIKIGLNSFLIEDITFNTLPTYKILKEFPVFSDSPANQKTNNIFEWVTRLGLLRYLILSASIE
ncbi:class I SAM-dependent methyltransferase [Okeania sp. SIO1F9]|uniref:class I SAM-dependent methyltransferase n=1 Tax=Okeania sp. SIO1F9 TaxID=2607813 RepID=UPI00144D90CC|nr:class I SAM-dependent methyltransferase [Okeania sp. SIO1F9]NET78498.1 class I SAM-dependent methyltransferase [Okeania sp. SIO1F9]